MLRLALLLLCSILPLHADPKRPLNVLFCFADDWGRYASAYTAADGKGAIHDLIHTPNIDRVAREGALFRHAFVNAPSCTPCRSALLSGRHFFSTGRGAILQGAYWDSTIPSFPLLLRDAGHHIGETFKVWSPGDPTDAPFGTGRYAYEKHGNRFNGFSKNASALVASGTPFPDASRQLLDGIGTNFDEFLAARPGNSPWFYWFGPTNVHRSWKQGSGKALWNIDPDRFKGRIPPHLPDVPATREDFSDYFGEIQAFDAAIGILLNRLESSGQIDNTLVVISGDHGMPGMPRGKCNLYDFGTAVALVARFPGRPGNRIIDDFTSLMDLAPTFLEAAGLPLPQASTAALSSRSSTLTNPVSSTPPATTSSPAANATSPTPATSPSPAPNAPSAPPTISTSATSPPTAGPWAIPRPPTPPISPPPTSSPLTPTSPSQTWTPAPPKHGSSSTAVSPNGRDSTISPSPNAPPKNSTISAKTPPNSSISPTIQPTPPPKIPSPASSSTPSAPPATRVSPATGSPSNALPSPTSQPRAALAESPCALHHFSSPSLSPPSL